MKTLALLALALALAPRAWAEDPCDDCRQSAAADAAKCHHLVLTATEGEGCKAKLDGAMRACQEGACKAEVAAKMSALCPDCLKSATAEAKKCEALPAASSEREACAKRTAGMKKACEEKFCGAQRAK